jgi:subtilisin family serine protease
MKKLLSFIAVAVVAMLIYSCTKQELTSQDTTSEWSGELVNKTTLIDEPDGEPYTKAQVDAIVKETLIRNDDFRWEMVDFKVRWSAIQYGDQSVAIGYKPAQAGDIADIIHKTDVRAGVWKEVHDNIIAFVTDELSKIEGERIGEESLIIEDDPKLPIITFRLTDRTVLTKLMNLENVRYIEPLDYWHGEMEDRSTSGCAASSTTVNVSDYTAVSPTALLPWNFSSVNIPASWSVAQGQGITIGVIDAGISSSQTLLGSNFNNGESNVGRTITTDFTWGNSAFTSCTHGTSMCGLAAGPKNNQNATTGVAFKANIHFIRGCEDVVLDKSSERTGLKNALVKMGDKMDVKVISMSIGSPFYSSVIEDGVNYAWNQGKMMMAAAGTSFSWTSWWGVVYPAALNRCLAITGVKENFNTCSSCHDGSQVDFTVTMERNANSNRNSLSLPASGVAPRYIGGSSAATAIAAGIAANVWSVNPNFSREQVYNYLLTTSQYYPNPNSNKGYGNLNAGAAVIAAQAPL